MARKNKSADKPQTPKTAKAQEAAKAPANPRKSKSKPSTMRTIGKLSKPMTEEPIPTSAISNGQKATSQALSPVAANAPPAVVECPDCGSENEADLDREIECLQCGYRWLPKNGVSCPDPISASVAAKSVSSQPPATPDAPAAQPSRFAAKMAAIKAQTLAPHLVIVARAGCGKTTTLIEGLKVLRGLGTKLTPSPQQAAIWDALKQGPEPRSVAFCAFNSAIAKELKDRVPPGCDAKTLHSLGYGAVRKQFNLLPGDQAVNKWRTHDILCRLMKKDPKDYRRDQPVIYSAVPELVGKCKMNLVEHPEEDQLIDLARHYNIDLDDENGKDYADEIVRLVPEVLEACKDVARDGCIDYNDMIWLPVVLTMPVYRYDLLMVDEAQDLSRCQQALTKKAGNRIVAVGDDKQAIYGFAGADCESLPRLAKELSDTERRCLTMPLTVTRRCGKAIVEEARRRVSGLEDFEAHDSNCVGKISFARYED